jgi:hypothetical protein
MTETIERQLPTGEGLTFEKVWAMFQETREQMRETSEQMKETDKKFKETDKKFQETREQRELDWKEIHESLKETERIVKRNSRQMGKLSNKFGKLAEHLVAPGIVERFKEKGIHFKFGFKKGGEVYDQNGRILTQIDLLLENDEYIAGVEVKASPVEKDVGHHIKRLEILRESIEGTHKSHLKILGAIAGAIYEDSVKKATWDAGFYVIEQSGDTMKIDKPEGWVPVEY